MSESTEEKRTLRPLSYSYKYSHVKHENIISENSQQIEKLKKIFPRFQDLRGQIFELRYDAEQIKINTTLVATCFEDSVKSLMDEFDLIYPVIVKLSEAAEFISERELADWEREHKGKG